MSVSWNGKDAPTPPGSSYGYARVSTTDQDLTVQYEALERAGCRVIRAEKVSGTSVQGRQELRTLLDFIRDFKTSRVPLLTLNAACLSVWHGVNFAYDI